MRYQLCIPLLVGSAMAFPGIGRAKVDDILLQSRDDSDDNDSDFFDPEDLSWITKLAAIGDSYSAGIGAGDKLGNLLEALDSQSDYACSRYDNAYPNLVNEDGRLGYENTGRDFQFRSCSGAVTSDILKHQIPNISPSQQAILLSVGGNDVKLTDVLNQCVFQWAALDKTQAELAKIEQEAEKAYDWIKKMDIDWDALAIGCQGQLKITEQLIDSDDLSKKLDSVLEAAKLKLSDDGMIYFTGYAKFFGTDMSSDCDDVSWSTWAHNTYSSLQSNIKLTKVNRQGMNDLVDKMNDKLKAAADRAGSKVRFINYDDDVGYFNGRFCEPGVDESIEESNSRVGLMFYELSTFDPRGNTPWKRSQDGAFNGTFQADVNALAQIAHLAEPDATFAEARRMENSSDTELSPINKGATAKPSSDKSIGLPDVEVPNFLPDGYGRVFHPTILLHHIIANRVIFEMASDYEKREGYTDIPRTVTVDSCPTKTSTSDSTPSDLTCWDKDDWTEGGDNNPDNAVNPDDYKNSLDGVCEAFVQGFKKNDYLNNKSGFSFGKTLVTSATGFEQKYWFSIGLNGEDSCDIKDPGDPFGDGSLDCQTIFNDDIFSACPSNGGKGGHVKVGCLTYGFEPCENITTTVDGGCWSAGGTDSMLLTSIG